MDCKIAESNAEMQRASVTKSDGLQNESPQKLSKEFSDASTRASSVICMDQAADEAHKAASKHCKLTKQPPKLPLILLGTGPLSLGGRLALEMHEFDVAHKAASKHCIRDIDELASQQSQLSPSQREEARLKAKRERFARLREKIERLEQQALAVDLSAEDEYGCLSCSKVNMADEIVVLRPTR